MNHSTGNPTMSAQSTSWWTVGVVRSVSQLQIVFFDTFKRSPIWV